MVTQGFELITGGTDNHLILANVYKSLGVTGAEAEIALDKVGLTLNKNAIADDPLPPFRPSGIRLGTPAITTRGMTEKDMALLADWMKRAIDARNDEEVLNSIHDEVVKVALQYPLPSDV
jgi:glycine hydroxymethyltransferase